MQQINDQITVLMTEKHGLDTKRKREFTEEMNLC